MMKYLTSLMLMTVFFSCSPELDQELRDRKYLIEVDFGNEIVKDGGIQLHVADNKTANICSRIINDEIIPDGFSGKVICVGSGLNNIKFYYVELSNESVVKYYLVTSNDKKTLTHFVSFYEENSCLKRWINTN